ncbi:phage tail-collar fiber domain-containing protein [Schinkia azotoformans]|uniref:phage tail-collar fiber domain-containing protein n=1 Tax=Schinkia azotoformans TaxID=1454 RepID=UPI002DBBE526|nr:phage tail protein [Schinkia azotoformans]MEC1744107.1 phage tail protein [Schinkia azotoformans]
MGAFGGLILTNRGRNLQAKSQAGVQLKFTRIAIGDGLLNGASIVDLNALRNERKTLSINKLNVFTNRATVGAILRNQDVPIGFYFREIGLFALDPDIGEILYCYGNADQNAEFIPSGGGADIIEKSIDINAIIGNASSITAIIDESLIFMPRGPLTWNQLEGLE